MAGVGGTEKIEDINHFGHKKIKGLFGRAHAGCAPSPGSTSGDSNHKGHWLL